jgi:hypothetical protein
VLAAGAVAVSTTTFAGGVSFGAGDYLTITSTQGVGGTPAVSVFVQLLVA